MFKKTIVFILFFGICAPLNLYAGGKKGDQPALVARQVSSEDYEKSAEDMIISFIDVGQGNCILIESPAGKTMLVDAGGTPTWSKSSWDPGMEIVVPYLESRGIEKLDYMVMTHAHDDHIGGLPAVLYNLDVDTFCDPGYVVTAMLYKELLKLVKKRNINYVQLRAGSGDQIDLGAGIKCQVLSPPADHYFQGTNSDCNNSSIVLRITYKGVSVMLTGDMERRGELSCVKEYSDNLESNILQVGHHGSYTSSTRPFLAKVMPEIAVIMVGKNNRFGHPRPETLNNLESVGAELYRTDFDGTTIAYTDGKRIMVETSK